MKKGSLNYEALPSKITKKSDVITKYFFQMITVVGQSRINTDIFFK